MSVRADVYEIVCRERGLNVGGSDEFVAQGGRVRPDSTQEIYLTRRTFDVGGCERHSGDVTDHSRFEPVRS
jgi:hypothetical protein